MPLRTLRALQSKAITLRGSLIRTGVFVVAWIFLPSWLFVLIALVLYFIPPAQAETVIAPFFALLALGVAQPVGFAFAVVFAALFLFILLIKELYIIDRKSAYEMLMLALVFLLVRAFYLGMDPHPGLLAGLYAFIIAGFSAWMVGGFIRAFSPEAPAADAATAPARHPMRRVAVFTSFLLFFELLMIGSLLPLNFAYQSAVVFLLSTLIIELVPHHVFDGATRKRMLTIASVVFALIVLVLGSARWEL